MMELDRIPGLENKGEEPFITKEGLLAIFRGEAFPREIGDPEKAGAFLVGHLKLTIVSLTFASATVKVELIDPETEKVIIHAGVFVLHEGGTVIFKGYEGRPITAMSWPVEIQ